MSYPGAYFLKCVPNAGVYFLECVPYAGAYFLECVPNAGAYFLECVPNEGAYFLECLAYLMRLDLVVNKKLNINKKSVKVPVNNVE